MKATSSEEYDFHRRILARNDPIAFSMLAKHVYDALVQRVQRRADSHADAVLIEEAVGQALLDYRDTPERYDPNRMDLLSYLALMAYSDFQNAQRKEQRRAQHVTLFSQDELQQLEIEDISVSQEMRESEAREQELWRVINAAFPDPVERELVLLILNKVHSIEPYARLLGLDTLPQDIKRKRVERVKDRIKKRLRRHVVSATHKFDV